SKYWIGLYPGHRYCSAPGSDRQQSSWKQTDYYLPFVVMLLPDFFQHAILHSRYHLYNQQLISAIFYNIEYGKIFEKYVACNSSYIMNLHQKHSDFHHTFFEPTAAAFQFRMQKACTYSVQMHFRTEA